MRKVEIVEDAQSQRCWVAVDVKSGEPLMRLHDRGLLERLCNSLEWKIVQPAQRSRSVVREWEAVGGHMIYYVALPFVRVEGGLAPGEAVECPHAAAAIRRAQAMSG